MTVRASPPISHAKSKAAGAPSAFKVAAKAPATAATTNATTGTGTPTPIPRILTKAERADEEAAKNAPPIASGTHRFTLVDKEALQLMSGKKPSSCECQARGDEGDSGAERRTMETGLC
jgi:hypothetical protein